MHTYTHTHTRVCMYINTPKSTVLQFKLKKKEYSQLFFLQKATGVERTNGWDGGGTEEGEACLYAKISVEDPP